MGPSWGRLGLSGGHLGVILGSIVAVLDPLGPSLSHDEATITHPGSFLGHFGAIRGRLGPVVHPAWINLVLLGGTLGLYGDLLGPRWEHLCVSDDLLDFSHLLLQTKI